MAKNNAKLPDLGTLVQAGIDPKTKLPIKVTSSSDCGLKENIRKLLRVNDEQVAINRFQWHFLPEGLSSELMERVLYYKGQAMFFYHPTMEKFFFLPYSLAGTIDVYGRYTEVTPLPFAGQIGRASCRERV